MNKKISVIIPTFNEEKNIESLLTYFSNVTFEQSSIEMIVVDGGSSDKTVEIVRRFPTVRFFTSAVRGRANQLNIGAQNASGEILFFVHADTRPPENFALHIQTSFSKNRKAGCFAYRFDSPGFMLKILASFTRFNWFYTGGGDQTLFICKDLFKKLGGYNQEYVIMEDFELTSKLIKDKNFVVLPQKALVSARKYEKNSFFQVSKVNGTALRMFKKGCSPQEIKKYYSSNLK